MEFQPTCSTHEGDKLAHVCLEKECWLPRFSCQKCKSDHNGHSTIDLKNYLSLYGQFEALMSKTYCSIKNAFKHVSEVFQGSIKSSESMILTSLCGNFNPMSFPPMQNVQFQQLYGITDSVISNPVMKKMLQGNTVDASEDLKQDHKRMISRVTSMEENLLLIIKESSQHFNGPINELQIPKPNEFKIPKLFSYHGHPDFFSFSNVMKNELLTVQGAGSVVTRTSPQGQGLSVFCLTQEPLTRQNPEIRFRILNQVNRFMYFGVCRPDTFSKHSFMGPVYKKGNHMYGIRQNEIPSISALSLHNSISSYSNQQIVDWDFSIGDCIGLRYDQDSHDLTFSCREKKFVMPLDDEIKKMGPFPFVGMKFQGDSIAIERPAAK